MHPLRRLKEEERLLLHKLVVQAMSESGSGDDWSKYDINMFQFLERELRLQPKTTPKVTYQLFLDKGVIDIKVRGRCGKKAAAELLQQFCERHSFDPTDWYIKQSIFNGSNTRLTCRSHSYDNKAAKAPREKKKSETEKFTDSLKGKTSEEQIALIQKQIDQLLR